MMYLSRTRSRIVSTLGHRIVGRTRIVVTMLSLTAGCAVVGLAVLPKHEAQVTTVFTTKLPNVSGSSITMQRVYYAPGGKSQAHRHAGSVLVYVLSGSIRSQNSATGPSRIYKTGESFFEPPMSQHLTSENASQRESASLLAVFVAQDGAELTKPLNR